MLLSDLWIQTKGTDTEPPSLVQFVPNAVQEHYLDQLCPDWRIGVLDPRGLREIVLKARQFGFSTMIAALFFLQTVNNPDTNTVVIADAADNTEELFAKIRMMWENLPAEKRPKTRYNNRRQLYFPDLRSKYTVTTAGKKTAGRSQTIHNLHCSEVPHWQDPSILTGLLQAVPRNGNVFLESTAKGEDAVFCAEYRKGKANVTPYAARFFAWWQHDEYEAQPPRDYQRDEEDETVAQKHGLDAIYGRARANRKLYWRRLKKSEPGQGSLFAQEYPGDDKEAFLVSGSRFFTEWDEEYHTFYPDDEAIGKIERFWQFFGGYDWGIGAPACFLLGVIDQRGRVLILDEVYGANRTDPEQAADVKACLQKWNLRPADVPIYADSAMWAERRDTTTGKRIANVLAFFAAGLRMVKAVKNRRHGWANVKRYLHDIDVETDRNGNEIRKTPFLRVSKACANLIRTQAAMVCDDKDPEDADTEAEDHAWDTLQYMLSSRPRPSGPEKEIVNLKNAPTWYIRAQKRKARKL